MSHKGSHGTCKSRQTLILNNGFKQGDGYRGKGVYFYRESKYWLRLPKSWYRQCLDQGRYDRELERGPAVLLADLAAEDQNFLNMEDADLREEIEDYLDRCLATRSEKTRDISQGYNLLFSELEKDLGEKIKLVRVSAPPPRPNYCSDYYNFKARGAVSCYVVRDRDIISINRCLTDEEIEKL